MTKRIVNSVLFLLGCLVLLMWQLSGPVYVQAQTQSAPDPEGIMNRSPGAGTASAQSDLASKKVLILHSFAYAQPVYKIIDKALIESFVASGLNFNKLYFEFLDLARYPDQRYRNELINFFRQKYQGRKFDLVVALHQQSLEFLLKEGQSFYPEGPIICILGDPVPDIEHSDSKRPLIYLPFSIDIISTVKAIFTLQPDTQKIVVIAGSAPVDRRFLDLVQAALKGWKGNLDVEFIPPLPLDEILKKVAQLPAKTAILYTNVAADSTGKTYIPRDVALMISRSANAPVFGLYETLLGDNGIVGGIILNHQLEGERAVQSAMGILRGHLPSKPLTILPAPLVPMFDWLQMKRWGFKESALAANAIILNKPASAWERYRFYGIVAMAFVLAQSFLIVGLLVQRCRKKVAEESLQQKSEELDQFFNVSLDLKCIANTDAHFLRLNPAWEKTLGYTLEELMANPFLELVHPDDLSRTREAVSTLESQQKVISFENRYRCKDGTYRWLEWISAPAGKLIYAAARDVTERKHAEEALEDRLQFEQLLSGLSARFVIIPPDRVDSEIEEGLRKILEFFQVDHCALLRILPGKTSFQITHIASSDHVPPVPLGVDLPRSLYPWAYEKLVERHEVVSISRLDDLPAEANVDRQTCIEWGIRSYANIPILVGEFIDFIHVSSVKSERGWPEGLFPRLRLLGEIFVNALQRKQAEEASRESERNLRQNESDLQKLAGRLIYAQEEERSRLARELHDDLAQRLTVFAIDVGRLDHQLMDSPAPVREELREMQDSIVRISQDVHSLSRQLHPSILDDLGLIKAAESECTSFSRREGIEVVFKHENIPRVIPKDVSLSLYRIIQEGLMNISKHACAEHISISLKGLDYDVLLSVQDDGIGLDWAEVKENPGLGFLSMRERTRLIHGELSIQSQPENGTVITLRVPLAGEAA